MLPRALQSWRAVPRTLVGDWWRREEGGRQRWEVSAEGAQLARVPCTKTGERGAQHRQSAAASRASRTAMGLSRSPRPPPLVLLLVLSLWLPLGTGKCLRCIRSARIPGAVGQMVTEHRLLLLRKLQVLVAFLCP